MSLTKLIEAGKKAENLTFAAIANRIEQIAVVSEVNKDQVNRVARAILALKKEVDGLPLNKEAEKVRQELQKAETAFLTRVAQLEQNTDFKLKATENRLRKEISDRIPDIVTITEKVTEVAKELDDIEIEKVLARVPNEELVKKIRDVIENFDGEDRLDASKLKNLPQLKVLNAGGGSNLSVFKNGQLISSSTRLDFVGSGVSVENDGGRTKVTINAGSGTGVTVETPTGTVDATNASFTVTAEPKWIVSDGITYFDGAGYTYAALSITMDVPPSQFIRAII